jgi:hypothetical protein
MKSALHVLVAFAYAVPLAGMTGCDRGAAPGAAGQAPARPAEIVPPTGGSGAAEATPGRAGEGTLAPPQTSGESMANPPATGTADDMVVAPPPTGSTREMVEAPPATGTEGDMVVVPPLDVDPVPNDAGTYRR